jgi:hypothetical protein
MYQTGPDMGFFFPFIPGRYLLVLGTNLKLSYQSCTHIRSKAHLCLASGKLKKPGTYWYWWCIKDSSVPGTASGPIPCWYWYNKADIASGHT